MNKLKIAELWSVTKEYSFKVKSASHIIANALNISNSAYVAFSGGKDSTVVFDLVNKQQKPETIGIWSDDEWYLPETIEYINRMQLKNNIHHIRTNAIHSEWFYVSGDWNGIPDYAKKSMNMELVFLGLRQDENSYRRIHLRKFGSLYFAQSDDTWHCNPIYNWTWKDVWAYIVSNNIDYNKAYDKLDKIGVDPKYQRIGPLAVDSVLGYGQLSILKRGWPNLFNDFVEKYPEARGYV